VPAPSPADWYPDPFDRHERRYWDGSKWTEHVASRGRQEVDPPVDEPPVPTAVTPQTPADWYPDPFGRHERRYWDGSKWTEHVASRGRQEVDPPATGAPVATGHDVTGLADAAQTGETAIFTEPVLVVSQKAKLKGSNVAYAVRDQHGQQIGSVQEVGRGFIKKAMDKRTDVGRAYRLQVVDMSGRVLIAMTRPEVWFKAKMIVEGPHGNRIGQIAQDRFGLAGGFATVAHAGLSGWTPRLDSAVQGLDKIGHARFRLESGDQQVGPIHAENLNAWDFHIQDATGGEIARITKTWAGWAKERFTKADNYVVEIHRPLEEPLRSLVIAAALAVDIELKQGSQTSGSSLWGTRRYE